VRVLYFHQYYTSRAGAGGTRSYEMARALLERGHEVTIVCGSAQRSETGLTGEFVRGRREGVFDGIRIIEFALGYSNHMSLAARARAFLAYALRSMRLALSYNYDVLIATSTPLTVALPGIAARLLRRKPFVFEIRDLWPEIPKALGMKNPLTLLGMELAERLGYASATVCIGLSPGIVAGIRRKAGPRKDVALVPNGCDTDLFVPAASKGMALPGVAPDKFTAIFCGAHGVANGLDAAIDAAEVLERRAVRDIQLVFIGDGNQKARLKQRCADKGLGNVVFVDSVSKNALSEQLPRADVGLMLLRNVPAFYYGTSPNKFFDYLAAGLPVLTNYPGWVADLVGQHECGVAVSPDDPEAFAQALISLRDRGAPALARIGQNARGLALAQFERQALASQWVAVLEAAAPGGGWKSEMRPGCQASDRM
jgi:glycosyltransferase involved in cell wall biosynthesis